MVNSFVRKRDQKIVIGSISVIDFLSSSDEFRSLIKQLQHARLINYVNLLKNVTFIAPTEKAFYNRTKLTTEILKYHILNGLLFTDKVDDGFIFRSHIYTLNGQECSVGVKVKRIVNPNTGKKSINIGGVSIVKGNYITRNGVIQVTNEIMVLPEDMYSVFLNDPDMSTFMNLIDHGIFKHKKITIFAPSNDAFKIFNNIEYTYLLSKYGVLDLKILMLNHLLTNTVIYKSDVIDKFSSKSDANEILSFSKNSTGFYINGYKVIKYDIITKNGVIHKISNLLVPMSLEFTPLKYLYGMDTRKFADEIFFAGLANTINNKTIEQVIFAPIDSSLYLDTNMENNRIVQEIKYHFISGWFDLNVLEDQKLLTTGMKGKLLGGKNQKIKISRKKGKLWLNDRSLILGGPFTIGKTKIYRVDSELVPPLSFPAAAAPMFHISTTMEYLYNTNIDTRLYNRELITYLVPLNSAWDDLGLVRDYLVLDSSKDILSEVLLNTIFNGLFYFEELIPNKTVTTLMGLELIIQKKLPEFSIVSGNSSHIFQIEDSNILLENGVAHTISRVFMPPNLNITPRHLFLAKNISLFPRSIESTNFFYALNLEEKFTILAPIDSAWKIVNSTTRTHSALQEIIKLHLLPPVSNNSDFLKDIYPRQSLHKSGINITASKIHDSLYHIIFRSSKNCYQQVNILGEGKTTLYGQILVIDRVLDPSCAIGLSYIHMLWVSFSFSSFFTFILLITSGFISIFSNRRLSHWDRDTQNFDQHRPFCFFRSPNSFSSRPILRRMLTV
ncbi:uncharacterized protein T551_02275 [Pneumocystis jirovecii RU7]|uniref:FAS1 domain-containing protein n=1 Tax=Pneumocystis jirovecii (strain RU7) TaxID=1408657 RepID=A0A0W4ZKU0_PNEJ7|nr:uncharacterized protein T551_02275 [Pneumocystis jirovecii RU7]KTW29001.1 hypothetical protein T551_02275 [Pneumocystis jirovecii RU7]